MRHAEWNQKQPRVMRTGAASDARRTRWAVPQDFSGSDCFASPDGGAGGQLPSDDQTLFTEEDPPQLTAAQEKGPEEISGLRHFGWG
jgi:hypothetical protein